MCDAIAPFSINSIQEMGEHTLLLLLRKLLIVCRGILSFINKNYFAASIISPYFNTPPLHKTVSMNKIIVSLVEKQTVIHILPNILRGTDNQTTQFGRLIVCYMRCIFLKKSCTRCSGETSPRFFSEKLKLSISLYQ